MAFVTVGIIVRIIGVDPFHALRLLVVGAIGSSEAIGYTLYYTTNFIFTGLAVAVAFHAGLFNIGGEGQAYIGGLGCGLAILAFDRFLPAWAMIPLAIVAAALFGAAWAAVPAWLQAWRGSHIVITTIMFNFVASALMVYLMVNVLIAPGSMTPQSRTFTASGKLPSMQEVLGAVGIQVAPSALNLSIVLAVFCCVGVWVFLWHTPWGYELRTMGHNPEAAVYAGTSLKRMTMLAMCLSRRAGGLRGRQRADGRAPAHRARLSGGLRLRRHRRRPDGPQPPAGHRAGGPAVRRPAAGRRRACLRHPDHHPRDGGGDPGPDHPVLRRAGASAAAVAAVPVGPQG